jgi:hypothetical protein
MYPAKSLVSSLLTLTLLLGFTTVWSQSADQNSDSDANDGPIRVTRVVPAQGGEVIFGATQNMAENASYRLSNRGRKSIRAYAVVLTSGKNSDVKMGVFYGRLLSDDQRRLGGYILRSDDKPHWSFDWILFEDGTTWGPDKHARSKEILEHLRGRQAAIDRGLSWIGYAQAHPLRSVLDPIGGMWWTYSLSPFSARKVKSETEDFDRGYDSVITSLLFDADRNKRDLSRQIAEDLKAHSNAPPPR